MRESKLTLKYRTSAEIEWRLLYRLFRATKSDRTLETIGVFTPQQLIIRMLDVAPLDKIQNARRRMDAARKAYYAFRKHSEHDHVFSFWLGGVHHNFGDFIQEDAECMDKYDVNEYRFSRGLKPVKWKTK